MPREVRSIASSLCVVCFIFITLDLDVAADGITHVHVFFLSRLTWKTTKWECPQF